jgi:hypothetical protein
MSKSMTKLTMIGGIALALALAGCGNRMPANVPEPEESAPAETPAEPTTPAVTDPVAPAPTVPTTPAYVAPITGSLVVSGVEKSKSGIIFFKKMVVKGSVVNTSSVPLSGTVKCDFKEKKGIFTSTLVTEETKTVVVAQLAPGQSFPFEFKSDKSNLDEAEVTVETMAPAPAAAAAYPTAGSAYGAPTTGAYGAAGYPAPQTAYPAY